MRKLILAAVATSAIASPAWAAKAFLVREYTTGMTKTCIYAFLGSEYARTIKSYQMCPYSIDV